MKVEVSETRDPPFIRRWLLRPSFVRKMGCDPDTPALPGACQQLIESDARFFQVLVQQVEKGCIIFQHVTDGWELHLCLATWFSDTRVAVRRAIELLGTEPVVIRYPSWRRALHRLMDDLGFQPGFSRDGWTMRNL